MADQRAALLEAAELLGCPTVWTMAASGDVDGLRLVHTSEVTCSDMTRGWTACQYACERGQHAALVCLRGRGADVHRGGRAGPPPVWIAASGGSVQCLRLLLNWGVDADADFDDRSPLEAATTGVFVDVGRLQCAILLVTHGAHATAGFVGPAFRAPVLACVTERLRSHHGIVAAALGARGGRTANGALSPISRLDGHVIRCVGEFLRLPKRVVRRLERTAWVLESEVRDDAERANAVAHGFRRADHCFTIS